MPATPPPSRSPARPTVLHLAHRVPFPPDKGDRIRNYQILRFLAARADVHLACLADEPVAAESLAVLRSLARRVAVVPIGRTARRVRALAALARGRTATEGAFASAALRAVLVSWTSALRFDSMLASSSGLAPYLQLAGLREVPAVIDFADVDSQKWFDYAAQSKGPQAWLYRTEGRRLRRLEAGLATRARAVTLVSRPEAGLYREFAAGGDVRVVPNGVDIDYFRPSAETEEAGCVFVGALDYRPNVDGVRWFCGEVWPDLRRRCPAATLSLVGRKPAPAVETLGRLAGVTVVGQVPDVRPYVARAAAVVVPLRIARGVQNKVLEALAMAKAVVASPPALAALQTEPGVHLLRAADGGEWVEAVSRLLADADLRRRLGAEGRRYVAAHHDWERCLEPLAELLELAPAAAGAGVLSSY